MAELDPLPYRCGICEEREGHIREGHAVPTCARCFAGSYWRSRSPETRKAMLPSAYETAAALHTLAQSG